MVASKGKMPMKGKDKKDEKKNPFMKGKKK